MIEIQIFFIVFLVRRNKDHYFFEIVIENICFLASASEFVVLKANQYPYPQKSTTRES